MWVACDSVTNVPLSCEQRSMYMWSFDRIQAGSDYNVDTIEPVLHRYNDAKFTWADSESREWLRGFVLAHSSHPREQPETACIPGNANIIIDLEADEMDGSSASQCICLD